MLKVPFTTKQATSQNESAKGSSSLKGEPVDARSTVLCQLTAEELGAVAGGPEMQVGDGGG